jgi:hypothetical protein
MVILAVVALPVIAGAKAGDKPAKVTVCHLPDDGGAPHEIVVNEKALPAHIGHGDVEGNCDFADPDPVNSPPTAAIDVIWNICESSMFYGTQCTLKVDGLASSDPDGDPLSYDWVFSGPAGIGGSASGGEVLITGGAEGFYTFTLTVGDGIDFDTTTIELWAQLNP